MLETQNSRERLLDAADALMYDRGYEAVSVAYLCAAADARKDNLWPSKRDLALVMLGLAWERNCKRLFDPIFNNDDMVIEKFLNYGEFLANGFTANRLHELMIAITRFSQPFVECDQDEGSRYV